MSAALSGGPPKEEGGPATDPPPSTSPNSEAHGTAQQAPKPGAALELYRQRRPEWVPCTWPPVPQDINSQLDRRRRAAARCVPLGCRCRDPWTCTCAAARVSEKWIDAGREAALHLLEQGLTPRLDASTLSTLWRRGGDDRRLAQHLHQLTEGHVA